MKHILKITLMAVLFASQSFGIEIDKSKSKVEWKGTKVTGEHTGNLKFKSGDAQIKEGKLVGGEFVVDVNSLTVSDLDGDYADKFLGHMKSGDFFNVEKYPNSKLKIKSVKGNKVAADLTIKDKTNPVNFTYEKNGEAYVGSFKFDRTKFGMIYNSGNFFKDLGDKLIHNDVLVKFKFVPKK